MHVKILRILRAGPLSTLQDLGRVGYGQYGIPTAGAMDPWALQIGNLLLGNPRNSPGLEMTIQGIKAEILSPTVLAITGGTGVYTLNGHIMENWRTFPVEPGDVLDIRVITEGFRAYLTASGGLDVNMILGSGSTYLPAGLGGKEGRALVREDILSAVSKPNTPQRLRNRYLVPELVPDYPEVCTLRVVPGLHETLFSRETLDSFYSAVYVATPQSDRMGYRLQGRALKLAKGGALVSDAVVFGAVQVPPDGQPIILAADHQTTGGYPVIGVVASADFSALAQLRHGQTVRFQSIDLEEAQSIRREQERLLSLLALA